MLAETRTLMAARLIARAPRIVLLGAAGLLSVAGLRGAVAPPAPRAAPVVMQRAEPAPVVPFAEAFAREFLTWRHGDSGQREQRLAGYLADGLDPDGGLVPTPDRAQHVTWTVAAAPRAAAGGTWAVTVVAGLSDGSRTTLAIPVSATPGGLAVVDYPALTALTARASGARAVSWSQPVEDAGLSRVVERALRNYLAGRPGDLQADLATGARVVTPERAARLVAVEELDWQQRGHVVAALVTTELPDRTRLRLRFHLTVSRAGRWFVAGLDPSTPPTQGAPR